MLGFTPLSGAALSDIRVPVAGALAVTLDAVTLSAAGTFVPAPISGALSVTLDVATLASAGTVTIAPISGQLAVTLADMALSAAGLVTAGGALPAPQMAGAAGPQSYADEGLDSTALMADDEEWLVMELLA